MNRNARQWWTSGVALVLGVLLLAQHPSLAAGWKGSLETRDGVEYVRNPGQPMMDPVTITLNELWRIGGFSEAEEEFFGVIKTIRVDENGDVYLLDSQLSEVRVFSPRGEFLRTMGREGDGPGEFRNALDMFLLPEQRVGVLQLAPGRIVQFTREGEPAGDHPLPRREGGAPPTLLEGDVMGENLVLITSENQFQEGRIDITRALVLIDPQGREKARFLQTVRELSFVKFHFDETAWLSFDERWAVSPNGSLYAPTNFLDYQIVMWDVDGNRRRVITRDYEHRKRTPEQKEEMRETFDLFLQDQLPDYEIEVSDYDQDMVGIYPRENGELWVLTSRGTRDRPEGSLGVFDVFDADGRYATRVTLRGEGDPLKDGYTFAGDRLFVVTDQVEAEIATHGGRGEDAELGEDEPEPISVICYEVRSVLARK